MTLVKQPPDDAMVLWFVVSPLREGALVQYSSLFCAIFNYAALHPILRTLALGAARDAAAAHFAPRHRDEIQSLLIDARRFSTAGDLTAAAQGRALIAIRFGCVLPGAATTAPAQHISSVAAVKRFISEIGQRWSGGALNQAHFGGCGSPFKHDKPTPLK